MDIIEAKFLEACKTGNSEVIESCLAKGVDVNFSSGWGLRRTVRYKHQQGWDAILREKSLKINLANAYGLSALHTACRFNTVKVLPCLLKHSQILLNESTVQGSTPVMVAIKYGHLEVLKILLKDERVDLSRKDGSGRSLSGIIGVASSNCLNERRLEIFEMIRAENNRRENLKKKKISLTKNIAPRQFIVKQAREKVKKLVEEMDEIQNGDMMRFKENLENNSREFSFKQQSELETFLEDLNKSWEICLGNQEKEKNNFLYKLEVRKSVFLSMQKETKEEFYANEEYLQTKFKEKQFDDFASLQMREECKSLTARKSTSTCPSLDAQWGYLSGKTGNQNLSKNESKQTEPLPYYKDMTSRRNSAPICSNQFTPVPLDPTYITCPAVVPRRKLLRQNMLQMSNQTPSPVPSLEYVAQNIDSLKETYLQSITTDQVIEEVEIKVRSKQNIKTPKLSRKSTLDILREEEEKDQAGKDDYEIVSITNDGISVNKFPSFTNLVTQAQTPNSARKARNDITFVKID
eukprot:GFUD01005212.1.p1 GENE.GFUD01005212.1~~GFUD01005212.1.p1  ORF type:complete len:533 (-),score=128.99 GFUD01005212.1:42-1604(-)